MPGCLRMWHHKRKGQVPPNRERLGTWNILGEAYDATGLPGLLATKNI